MLVSAAADAALRRAVSDGLRPRPEYLVLEREHAVELLDWSRLPGLPGRRSALKSTVHIAAALRAMPRHDVVFSDGEHVGIPLALAMRALGISMPHLVIGHHLTTAAKARAFRRLHADNAMTRIVVHSALQAELAQTELGIPKGKLVYEPYYADTEFWSPTDAIEERLVVAAGREHRDYITLADACGSLDVQVCVAAGSVHSPAASTREPAIWPDNFQRRFANYQTLRDLYARASVVVVPLMETDFQAGVTTVLEAMSMGKPVVVTATRGRCDVIVNGENGILVPPGDTSALRDAIRSLLDNPDGRRRLGRAARGSALSGYKVELFAARLAAHIADLSRMSRAAA